MFYCFYMHISLLILVVLTTLDAIIMKIPQISKYLLFLSFFIFPVESFACRCSPKGNLNDEVNRYDLVFLGQVVEVKSAGLIRSGSTLVRLIPMKIYKGKELMPNLDIVTIFTPETTKDCGINFSKNIDYLIFAKGNPAFMLVDSCSLTDIQEKSKERLIELEKLIK
jgi:hypothetical protein